VCVVCLAVFVERCVDGFVCVAAWVVCTALEEVLAEVGRWYFVVLTWRLVPSDAVRRVVGL
jgi:hypothetical protein